MKADNADWSWVPKRDWEWMVETTLHGVHTYEGHLVWWERPAGPSGYMHEAAAVQSFADFLRSGPRLAAPEPVIEALLALLGRPPEASSR